MFIIEDLMERLRKMGIVYIKFGIENQEMYDLMFNVKVLMEYFEKFDNDFWDEGVVIFDLVKKIVEECMNKGYFEGYNVELFLFMIWSLVYGMCCFEIR